MAFLLSQVKNGELEAVLTVQDPLGDHFPKNPLICFYLAGCTAQLNRLFESTLSLDKAMEIAGRTGQLNKIRFMALDDPDLEPLLKGIGKA